MLTKKTAVSIVSAFALFAGVTALQAAPQGFDPAPQNAAAPAGPQGFAPVNVPKPVAEVKKNGYDDQHVVLKGRFTKQLSREKFEFTDDTGTIVAELDDDRNWSHIRKDAPVEITAEIERERLGTVIELDVKSARAL